MKSRLLRLFKINLIFFRHGIPKHRLDASIDQIQSSKLTSKTTQITRKPNTSAASKPLTETRQ